MSLNGMLKKLEYCVIGIQVVKQGVLYRGTGFFINEDGYALTCNHVVKDNDGVQNFAIFKSPSGPWNSAKFSVVLDNPDVDLAVIKLDTKDKTNFVPIIRSLSEKSIAGVEIGILGFHKAFDLGWPFVTHGIISAAIMGEIAKQYLPGVNYLFQIDSIVHGGCSGGPVFLAETEEVIGVLSQNIKEQNIPTNISFAIPIDQTSIDNIIKQLNSKS